MPFSWFFADVFEFIPSSIAWWAKLAIGLILSICYVPYTMYDTRRLVDYRTILPLYNVRLGIIVSYLTRVGLLLVDRSRRWREVGVEGDGCEISRYRGC